MATLRPVDADYLLRVLPLEPSGDRLTAVGFDADDRPTPEGMRLEELIDLLFTG